MPTTTRSNFIRPLQFMCCAEVSVDIYQQLHVHFPSYSISPTYQGSSMPEWSPATELVSLGLEVRLPSKRLVHNLLHFLEMDTELPIEVP
jgi:hypothetical protein